MFHDREFEQIRKWLQKKLRLRKVERFSVKWCVYVYVYVCVCVCPRYFSTGVRALVRGHVWYSNWLVLHIKGHLSHGKRDFNYVRIELLTGSWIDFSSSFLELILSRPRVVPLCWPLWFWCFSLKSLRYSFTCKNVYIYIFLCVVNYFIKNIL